MMFADRKKMLLFVIPILVFCFAASFAQGDINGTLTQYEGIPVLNLWGTPYEMGYAHGYLLADKIMPFFEDFMIPYTGSGRLYDELRDYYLNYWTVPSWYEEEAKGIIDGAMDKLGDVYIPQLERNLDATDLAILESVSDMMNAVFCTSLIAWGSTTQNDPLLQGEVAIARTGDWVAFPLSNQFFYAKNTTIIARRPDDGNATVSISFPGHSACISCMNEAGVSTMRLTSNHNTDFRDMDFSQKFVAVNFAMREGLEAMDPDGDEEYTSADLAMVVKSTPRSSAYNLMMADPDPESHPPFVLEVNHAQTVERYDTDNLLLREGTLIATQHMRKMYPPEFDLRTNAINSLLKSWNDELTLDRLWRVNQQAAINFPFICRTAQAMIFIPALRRIALTHSDDKGLAPYKQPVWFDWEDVVSDPVSDDDDSGDDDDANDDDDSGGNPDTSDDDQEDSSVPILAEEEDSEGGCGC